MSEMNSGSRKVAVVAGVGPGLGAALVRKFSSQGYAVGMLARSEESLAAISQSMPGKGPILPVVTDLSRPETVASAFETINSELGAAHILVNHASAASWKSIMDSTAEEFENEWRVAVMGAFHCSRAVIPGMLAAGSGSILFTGATSSIRGRRGSVGFSSAKFGLRGLADSMARELWPQGIHVAHIVVDGLIDKPGVRSEYQPAGDEPMLNPDAMAESYWHLVTQDRSSWTFELDLRPSREAFFE